MAEFKPYEHPLEPVEPPELAETSPIELTVGMSIVAPTDTRTRRYGRRVFVSVVVSVQLALIVVAYDSDHKTFGFQMFPESSRWEADIVRVQVDGSEVTVNDGWEYRWSDLVRGRGLTNPFVEHHADSGLRNQFGLFQGALDWVAANTPEDESTVVLKATVTYTDNGTGPFVRTFFSIERTIGADR